MPTDQITRFNYRSEPQRSVAMSDARRLADEKGRGFTFRHVADEKGTPRSSRREVRNPILALPAAAAAIADLTTHEQSRVRLVLLAIRDDARLRAEKCWRTHKAPMALYWKCVAVYTGHIARCLSKGAE